jgi:hypothetical protein
MRGVSLDSWWVDPAKAAAIEARRKTAPSK